MLFFFFKQKTAYEMRISDWSSDVCSSDLKGVEFGELRFVVRVRDTAGAEAIAERECNIIGLHDLADFLEIIVEETLLVVSKAPFGHDGAAARYDAGNAIRRHLNIRQKHARMDGELIDARSIGQERGRDRGYKYV